MADAYTIRAFATTAEYLDCVALQEETWGRGFSERVPSAILKVAQILGGVSAGAYDANERLVGFVFGMTGLREGELVHWSDMLAVRPEVRDSGLGRRLKAYQRDEVLRRGVEKMFWTFDPLQARNAHLNFSKLGIVVREYAEDMYGQTDSPLHRGIGTDRFIALWILRAPRVEQLLAMTAPTPPPDTSDAPWALAAEGGQRHPEPSSPVLSERNETVRIAIPTDIAALMADDPQLAVDWRTATRAAFTHYLAADYEVSNFVRGDRASAYIMTKRTTSAS